MKYRVKISRENLKEYAYSKATSRKVRNSGNDEGNSALINKLLYNILLKERG